MIKYHSPEEKEILFYYAAFFDDKIIQNILSNGEVQSPEEARQLARFFWRIVDQTVIDCENNVSIAGQTNLGSWCESIMQRLRSHFIAKGYIGIWEDESDKAL